MNIGNVDLIDRRKRRAVPVSPGGTLADYVPFYFMPYTPMLLNIKTGRNGVTKRHPQEIVILFSSIHTLAKDGHRYLFTDRHALLNAANFYNNPEDLTNVDWRILQRRDFQRDNNDLEKLERYQAEALVYKRLPIRELLGIICYNDEAEGLVNEAIGIRGIDLRVVVRPGWYV